MKLFLFVSILCLSSSSLFSQNIIGDWSGKIDIHGNQIPILFHFYKDSTGALDGRWGSPKQNANNLPFSQINMEGDSLHLDIKMISGSYEGKFVNRDSIAGIWRQGGVQLSLNFSRYKNAVVFMAPKRPQTPQPPFGYKSDNIEYSNADNTISYGATLTMPHETKKNQTFPVVILITGSGKQDRDETLFDHKSFAVIADYLTKNGIAVLRVDDRGMGKTTGNYDTSSSQDFAKDVEAGIQYLLSRKEVDRKHIGLIGHSEGGLIATMAATENKNVSFIVMLAGPGVPGMSVVDYQNELPMEKAGIKKEIIQKFLDLHHALIKDAISILNKDDYKNKVAESYKAWKEKQSAETLNTLIKGADEQVISGLQKQYSPFHSKWWRFFLTYDPAKDLQKLSIPVLALNGEKDAQVDPKINLPAIEAALKKSKSKNFKTVEMPGLNHLFQHCSKCTIGEYGELEETFSPEALKIMSDWIKEVVKG